MSIDRIRVRLERHIATTHHHHRHRHHHSVIMPPPPNAHAAQTLFKRGNKSSSTSKRDIESDRAFVRAMTAQNADAWRAPRVARAANVVVAVWRADEVMAEVVRDRGGHVYRFGTRENGRTMLFAEEIAFLVETERAVVFASERASEALSVRGTLELLDQARVTAERYATYAKLCRLGFTVRRFGASWVSNECEDGGMKTNGFARDDARRRDAKDDEAKEDDEALANAGDEREREVKRRKVERSSAEDVDQRVEEMNGKSRSVRARARRWWPRSGAREHAWLGPDIDRACEKSAMTKAKAIDIVPTFEVYQPNRKFSKKSPDAVSFYVYESSARPLDGREARALLDRAEGVPVRIATCRQSTVVMFTLAAPAVY